MQLFVPCDEVREGKGSVGEGRVAMIDFSAVTAMADGLTAAAIAAATAATQTTAGAAAAQTIAAAAHDKFIYYRAQEILSIAQNPGAGLRKKRLLKGDSRYTLERCSSRRVACDHIPTGSSARLDYGRPTFPPLKSARALPLHSHAVCAIVQSTDFKKLPSTARGKPCWGR